MRKTSGFRSRDRPKKEKTKPKKEENEEISFDGRKVLSKGENRIVYDFGSFVIKKPVNWLGVVKNRAEWENYNGSSVAPYAMAKTELIEKNLLRQEKLSRTVKVPKRYKSVRSICKYLKAVDCCYDFSGLLTQRVGDVEIGKNTQGEWRLFDCENIENCENFNIIENFRNRRV